MHEKLNIYLNEVIYPKEVRFLLNKYIYIY